MPPQRNPNISDEEFIELLNPGITRPGDDFLNRPKPANDNEPLAEGATYATSQTLPPAGGAVNDNEELEGQGTRGTANIPDAHPNRKISNVQAGLMITTAVIFDLIGLIPFVGSITSGVGAPLVFGMWFLSLGVPLLTPKKMASWGISWIAEIIPAVGTVLPLVTVGIVLVILIDRVEEKTGLNVMSLAKGNVSDLKSIGNNLKGQLQNKLTGATPATISNTESNDGESRITATGASVNPAVSK